MSIPRTSRERVAANTRVGVCNGARCRTENRLKDVALYRVGEEREPRWRCAHCFKVETGSNP